MSLKSTFRVQKKWTEEEKLQIVKVCLSRVIPQSEVMRRYGVSSYQVLHRWINRYGDRILAEELNIELVKKSLPESESKSPEESLSLQVKQLEKELREAQLKAQLYEAMIDIAEQDLKIPIRKKSGPQQSPESKQKKA